MLYLLKNGGSFHGELSVSHTQMVTFHQTGLEGKPRVMHHARPVQSGPLGRLGLDSPPLEDEELLMMKQQVFIMVTVITVNLWLIYG